MTDKNRGKDIQIEGLVKDNIKHKFIELKDFAESLELNTSVQILMKLATLSLGGAKSI